MNETNMPFGEKKEKMDGDGKAFGMTSLFCGIAALTLFCTCINVPLAIASFVFGCLQLAGYKQKWPAVLGMTLSGVSLLLLIVAFIIFGTMDLKMDYGNAGSYEEYFEQYFENLEELEDESF